MLAWNVLDCITLMPKMHTSACMMIAVVLLLDMKCRAMSCLWNLLNCIINVCRVNSVIRNQIVETFFFRTLDKRVKYDVLYKLQRSLQRFWMVLGHKQCLMWFQPQVRAWMGATAVLVIIQFPSWALHIMPTVFHVMTCLTLLIFFCILIRDVFKPFFSICLYASSSSCLHIMHVPTWERTIVWK